MIVKLPDGKTLELGSGVNLFNIAKIISPTLCKESISCIVDGHAKDMSFILTQDASINFLTTKDSNIESLEVLRHSSAHLLANALTELYPAIKLTVGPVIEGGFYYDFDLEQKLSTDDFEKIEKKMKEISSRKTRIIRSEHSKEEILNKYKGSNEFKVEILESIPSNEAFSIYTQGDFFDLCRGTHVPDTGYIKNFKLLKISGAYFKGDQKNKMLQRIYGTAFFEKENLDKHLSFLEEAKKRDHRKIGKDLNLFHQQEEAKGDVFWHNDGTLIYNIIKDYIREKLTQNNYQEVMTPQVVDKALWEKSGHWDKFGHGMMTTKVLRDDETECAIKPMNCPCHVQIFNANQKSYKDLPIRMAEFGKCHRYEPSGSLYGIMRLRSFVQDDAHVFCTIDQIKKEILDFIKLLTEVYNDFGFKEFKVKFSDRPEKRAGKEESWDYAEKTMIEILDEQNISYSTNKGEGAFYGPKYEFVLKDAIGRDWQCGTLQLDFVLPERLSAFFISPENEKKNPVMIHRAILGSIERFIAILIENCEGKFPLWLAPVQVCIIGVSNKFDDYIVALNEKFKANKIRSIIDISSETVSYKIRNLSNKKTRFIITIGQKEIDNGLLSVKELGSEGQKEYTFDDFTNYISAQIKSKQ